MKDAVGSSILFYIILIFLAIFIVFIAFIMNYATAYRASNYVVTMIERYEGAVDIGSQNSDANEETLYGALKVRNYYNSLEVSCLENANGPVYKVITTIPFKLPIIEVSLDIKVQNETKTIYGKNIKCNNRAIGSVASRNK